MVLDWKEIAMAIIDGVGAAEGVIFESYWPLPDDVKMQVQAEYAKWYEERKKANGEGK